MPALSIKKKAMGNMGALVVVQILNYILPIITIPVIVRIIGPSKFGIINYTSAIIGYFVLFIGFSFELSASRLIAMKANDLEQVNQIFNKVFFSKIVLFLISGFVFICLLFGAATFQNERLIAIYTYLVCLASVFDCNYLYAGKQDLKQTALFNLITKIFLNISLLFFIRKQADYIYQPLIISLSQILVGFFAFLWAIRRYHLTLIFPGLSSIWQVIWKDKTLFFHSFAHTIYTTINIIMLGFFRGPAEVGYYSAGWKLIILIQALLISPLGMVLFPIVGQAFGRSKNAGLKIIQQALPFILLATLGIGIGILIFGGLFITIFYGAEFQNSILIFRLLAFMPMMLALNMLFGIQTMVNLKMDKKIVSITLSAAFINILLNLLLIHFIGSSGAAISWFLTETFCMVTMYVVITKNNVRLFKSEYFKLNVLSAGITPVLEKIKLKLKRTGA